MQQPVESSSSYSCATLRYVTDPIRDISLPVGVVLWRHGQQGAEPRLHFRLPNVQERVEDLAVARALPFLNAARAQLEGWLARGELPYCADPPPPLSDRWWEHARRLLKFSVRLETPRALDCRDPERELESLFDALVQPKRDIRERNLRIEQAIGRALGRSRLKRFRRGYEAPGFQGRPVKVLRAAEGPRGLVVIEGVNLALNTAEPDADRLASKVGRVRQNAEATDTHFVLGFLASPGGLNGEAALKAWIEQQSGSPMYDLDREPDAFRSAVESALSETTDALGVLKRSVE
jgi:hypothetical protein